MLQLKLASAARQMAEQKNFQLQHLYAEEQRHYYCSIALIFPLAAAYTTKVPIAQGTYLTQYCILKGICLSVGNSELWVMTYTPNETSASALPNF